MKKISILSIALACLVSSCNGQSLNVEQCKEHFKNSKKAFNTFYTEQNQNLLSEALKEVELSQNCPETRLASIELKISILSAKKDYQAAYKFVESIDKNDFAKPYRKDMQSNLFKALDCESKSDLINRNLYLKKATTEIESFINEQKITDQEAYYDLFLIKSKLLSKNELDADITLLEKKYPADKIFFELLKESFKDEGKQISVSNTK
jgi:hypothetical protein